MYYICRKRVDMATYTITVNERTARGKNVVAYLKHLGLIKESGIEKSLREYNEGKYETFSNTQDLFNHLRK